MPFKNNIAAREKTPSGKIVTIPNGVDAGLFLGDYDKNKIKKILGIHKHDYCVGMIANFRKIKGPIYFLKAAAETVRKIPDVKFLIIGKDCNESGCSQKDLIDLAREDGETGFLFPAKDVDMLSEIIINFLKNYFKRALIGLQARRKIKADYNLQLLCE
ncbi:glycosyltransferase family protein [Desulfobacula toluolica]|uniref:Putative glycosyl transferase, family I n=1 Tax=Desulfobacula toluolica (strain DSM 7467 / Tol2) TaxID=651182 RepID=K0NHT3_DESTT|nr:glycosyltransferase family 4 protein [Desulfobacula toluolica]CCK80490.1 putative glycosyl transferase, family I [Desulfobacula toluolica Tol2]